MDNPILVVTLSVNKRRVRDLVTVLLGQVNLEDPLLL